MMIQNILKFFNRKPNVLKFLRNAKDFRDIGFFRQGLKKHFLYTPFKHKISTDFRGKKVNVVGMVEQTKGNKAYAQEIIRRLKENGYDTTTKKDWAKITGDMDFNDYSLADKVNKAANHPIGIVKNNLRRVGGWHEYGGNDYAVVKRNGLLQELKSTMLHEGVSHGTDAYVEHGAGKNPSATRLYKNWLEKANLKRTTPEEIANSGTIASDEFAKWNELRATNHEVNKELYDQLAKYNGKEINSFEDIEALRPLYEQAVDDMSVEDLAYRLSTTNEYGLHYAKALELNPELAHEYKSLLKYAPAAVGGVAAIGTGLKATDNNSTYAKNGSKLKLIKKSNNKN